MRVHQCGACRDVSPTTSWKKGRAPAARAGRGLFFGKIRVPRKATEIAAGALICSFSAQALEHAQPLWRTR